MPRKLCPPPVPVPQRQDAIRRTRQEFPGVFDTHEAAHFYLSRIELPPSRRWGFSSIAKNASTSTKHLLYRAEFGCKMTAKVTPPADINPAAAIHMQVDHRVFTRALYQGLSAADVVGPKGPKERICVVRDPVARAISSFRYICKSHTAQSPWFSGDRFRMNAVTGFDWDHHSNTTEGFHRFLDYISWQLEVEGNDLMDLHWRPQVDSVKPDVFQPTIIGRMEDMAPYWKTLSERLEVPLEGATPWENRQPPAPDALGDLAQSKAVKAKVEAIYGADFETFGY